MAKQPKHSRPQMPGYGILPETEGAGLLPWSFIEERACALREITGSLARAPMVARTPRLFGVYGITGFLFQHGGGIDQGTKPGSKSGSFSAFGKRRRGCNSRRGSE